MGFVASYRRHFGATESTGRLATGFASFLLGSALALLGIVIVVLGDILIGDVATRRETGILLAAGGLPLVFVGIQLTLPSRSVVHLVALAGLAVCFTGLVLFAQTYPGEWNQPGGADRSGEVIALYSAGLMPLIATVGTALVVNFISRHIPVPGHETDMWDDYSREPTMDEVMRDIEREVARQNISWGGMTSDPLLDRIVKLRAEFGADAVVSNATGVRTVEFQDDSLDVPTNALLKMRGRSRGTSREEDDTQGAVDVLRELRVRRQMELEASWWYRFKRWLIGLFTGRKARRRAAGKGPDQKQQRAEALHRTQ